MKKFRTNLLPKNIYNYHKKIISFNIPPIDIKEFNDKINNTFNGGKDLVIDKYMENQYNIFKQMETKLSEKIEPNEEINLTISSNIQIFNMTLSKNISKSKKDMSKKDI